MANKLVMDHQLMAQANGAPIKMWTNGVPV